MEKIDGIWYMSGLSKNARGRIKNLSDLTKLVEKVGFMPLFKNDIEGFSVEEHAAAESWWTGAEDDPWELRELAAREHKIAYGKFFDGRAGFISLKYLPEFVNFRRDGYDFDALWDEGKAKMREKKLMDLFELREEWFSFEMKKAAGFGKNGEKNFDGTITSLMSQTYVVICGFQKKLNKKGEEYGLMKSARYCTPERIWGYDDVTAAYTREPQESFEILTDRLLTLYPKAEKNTVQKILKR